MGKRSGWPVGSPRGIRSSATLRGNTKIHLSCCGFAIHRFVLNAQQESRRTWFQHSWENSGMQLVHLKQKHVTWVRTQDQNIQRVSFELAPCSAVNFKTLHRFILPSHKGKRMWCARSTNSLEVKRTCTSMKSFPGNNGTDSIQPFHSLACNTKWVALDVFEIISKKKGY